MIAKKTSSFSLDLCLSSGQSFAWRRDGDFWIGSICSLGLAIRQSKNGIEYFTSSHGFEKIKKKPIEILNHYFALDEDQEAIFQTFPKKDAFLEAALGFCDGLRILRQDPWECLAGFILSSTKQITQIQQIWQRICRKWGGPVQISIDSHRGVSFSIFTFPTANQLARCTEEELRTCGMGFRAPYLLEAAKAVTGGKIRLEKLRTMPTSEAREQLMLLKGVGSKIANCVLLFSLGKLEAFPIDTWILKVLRKIYFPKKRKIRPQDLMKFTLQYFGPYGGYAQQYLFHYARMNSKKFDIQF